MNKRSAIPVFISTIFIFSLFSCSYYGKKDILKEGFINPPDSSRPGVYWYITDGNFNMQSVTSDLEAMKKAGIGYVVFQEVNAGIPRGTNDFMSATWLECFKHTVKECERLGIRLILGAGPGQSGTGGPWVGPEESTMHLVAADTVITGPSVFNSVLPLAEPKEIFPGEDSLTTALMRSRNTWYKDVRVLAFPAPAGNERIRDIDAMALYHSEPFTERWGKGKFNHMSETRNVNSESVIKKEKIIDLTSYIKPDGRLEWLVPPGKWTIVRMVARNNGAVTHSAPVPGYGFETNKFDTADIRSHYEAYTEKLIRKVMPVKSPTGGGWTMLHIGGWDAGVQNWSNGFIEQFIKRRGYDPMLLLPVYEGYIINSTTESERFLWDVRQTSDELINEVCADYLRKLGLNNGFTLSIEISGMSSSSGLDLAIVADVPVGEFPRDLNGKNSNFSCFEAASAAHIAGKQVVAAKAFMADTTDAWRKYPGEMKNQGDWALTAGVNRIFFHSFAQKSPGDQSLPGITIGQYGVNWDRSQTFWPMLSDYHKYLSRCQFLLSKGKYVADILYLTPEGAPQAFMPPGSALGGTDELPDKKGYSFDGCSPKYFIENASIVKSRITFPGGTSYRILVLPDINTMTPELLTKIELIARNGGFIAGHPPEISPSLSNYPVSDRTLRALTEKMWGPKMDFDQNIWKNYLNGTVFSPKRNTEKVNGEESHELYPDYEIISSILDSLKINEDFISSGDIRYIHKSLPDREIYFISNRTGKAIESRCIFRNGTMNAELWDPVTGNIRPLRTLKPDSKGVSIKIKMDAWQSYFFIFYQTPLIEDSRSDTMPDFAPKNELMFLKGPWKAEFSKSWGGPGEVVFDTLCSWTEREEEGIRFYSGTVPYSIDFFLPENIDPEGPNDIYLDLGSFSSMARVNLNGKDLGVLWTPPMEVKINNAVRRGSNHLVIEVANLWINRLIGDEMQQYDGIQNGKWPDWLINGTPRMSGRYTFTTTRYVKKDDPLVTSGLLGPVRILSSGKQIKGML
jgi:hypothetical protein